MFAKHKSFRYFRKALTFVLFKDDKYSNLILCRDEQENYFSFAHLAIFIFHL